MKYLIFIPQSLLSSIDLVNFLLIHWRFGNRILPLFYSLYRWHSSAPSVVPHPFQTIAFLLPPLLLHLPHPLLYFFSLCLVLILQLSPLITPVDKIPQSFIFLSLLSLEKLWYSKYVIHHLRANLWIFLRKKHAKKAA